MRRQSLARQGRWGVIVGRAGTTQLAFRAVIKLLPSGSKREER
jgi:hypothetical protein